LGEKDGERLVPGGGNGFTAKTVQGVGRGGRTRREAYVKIFKGVRAGPKVAWKKGKTLTAKTRGT